MRHTGRISREVNVLGRVYLLSNHHRDGNCDKSMWIKNPEEEIQLFEKMLVEEWHERFEGWSIYRVDNYNEVIGESKCERGRGSRNSRRSLRIAMFEDGNKNSRWHGYPADYLNQQDRPSSEIFDLWVKNKIISKASKKRFQQGQGDIK